MTEIDQTFFKRIHAFVDWFIPANLDASSDVIQGVRMFLFSHLFGPFLGHTISISMLILQGHTDWYWWVFFIAVTLFWPFTIMLRVIGYYVPLALISIQNLIFCILWGSYYYGGISSPIMPWLITVPLLAFFYLPTRSTRIVVAFMIGANLTAFYLIYSSFGFPTTVPLHSLVGLGLVSTFCAGVYVSMMALYYANIVSSQFELEQEVERHLETARQLRVATEQVERATKAKSDFLARMSHELRNPLNAIIGYSELLIESLPAVSSQKSKDLASIRGAGHKLLNLVNDLLDLSKLEAGKMELCYERVSLAEFVNELASKWQLAMGKKDNKFHIELSADLESIIGDSERLRQVVNNLLSNAAKFTTHGSITLSVSEESGLIAISVKDTGVGMSSEQIDNLFETFGNRGHETSSSYRDDPGLGLPLTQRLCRSMGGDLIVDSEVGRGSSFTVRIPSQPMSADDHPCSNIRRPSGPVFANSF